MFWIQFFHFLFIFLHTKNIYFFIYFLLHVLFITKNNKNTYRTCKQMQIKQMLSPRGLLPRGQGRLETLVIPIFLKIYIFYMHVLTFFHVFFEEKQVSFFSCFFTSFSLHVLLTTEEKSQKKVKHAKTCCKRNAIPGGLLPRGQGKLETLEIPTYSWRSTFFTYMFLHFFMYFFEKSMIHFFHNSLQVSFYMFCLQP